MTLMSSASTRPTSVEVDASSFCLCTCVRSCRLLRSIRSHSRLINHSDWHKASFILQARLLKLYVLAPGSGHLTEDSQLRIGQHATWLGSGFCLNQGRHTMAEKPFKQGLGSGFCLNQGRHTMAEKSFKQGRRLASPTSAKDAEEAEICGRHSAQRQSA